MRVLIVCPSYPPQDVTCGVGDYTRCLATELGRQGVSVTVAASAAYRGGRDADGITVLPILDTPAWWRVVPADVIHVQYTPDLYRGRDGTVLLPLRARVHAAPPTVITFHTLLDGTMAGRARATWLLAGAAASISANEEVTAMVRRRLPWFAKWLAEIPIGSNIAPVPRADRAAVLARLALPTDALVLAHFGLVYRGKGLETLLDALAALRRHEPRAHLVVVGDTRAEDRPYRAELERRVDGLGLREAVVWTGRVSDAEASSVLGVADLFVVPFDDGASIRRGSLMAGIAHGLPVVSTRADRQSAYLRDGDNVALVAPRDAAALAARLRGLLGASGQRERLGAAARTLAESFAWPRIAARTSQVYERVRRR